MEDLGEILRRNNPKTIRQTNSPISSSASGQDEASPLSLHREKPPSLPKRDPNSRVRQPAGDVCPRCQGVGFVLADVPVGHPDFGKAIPCHCKQEERLWRRVHEFQGMSNLASLARYTFAEFVPDPPWLARPSQETLHRAYDASLAFARQPEGWLVLTGSYGCGKTHLAAAIANDRLDRNQAAIFVVVPDLLDHLRATFGPNSEVQYDDTFEQVRTTRLLILDDLGSQSATPWAQEKLFQLLNYRYNAQLPTVVTTNQRLEDVDQRLRSRLLDINLVQRLHIVAPDYRTGANANQSDLSTLSLHTEQQFHTFETQRRNLTAEELSNLRQVKQTVQNYADAPQGWLVLMGPHGTGKTHLAAAVANHQREQGHFEAMFVVVPDFLDFLRAAFNPQTPVPYDRRFDEIRKTPMLIFDDLGVESATPWAREKLFQLLNYRYSANLPTVMTTSATPNEMEAWLRSRIFDANRCQVCALDVRSYRGGADQQGRARRN
ncbi:MAG: ATP-binding protein [Caldilineaceae bacterium]|nr:ATP-binding protein [Caldilineaceae bacterium]